MKKLYCVVLVLVFVFGLSHSNFVFAEGEAAAKPAATEVKTAVVPAPAEVAEKMDMADEAMDMEEMEEESEDVKILREAAAKLKATDPALATKLEQLAEDFSW